MVPNVVLVSNRNNQICKVQRSCFEGSHYLESFQRFTLERNRDSAKLLKQLTSMNFEWNVFGVSDIRFYEYKYGIVAKNVNVNIRGIV